VFGYIEGVPIRVPRLTGFSPQDAQYALAFGYLQGHVTHERHASGLSRAIGQHPQPGDALARGGTVQLVIAGR
jgi:hypothetical protein